MTDAVHRVRANGMDLAYETFGDRGGEPVVLVMGLGTQMLAWPDELCEDLVRRGHFVVRFDNRDAGLSTHLDHVPPPTTRQLLTSRRPAYTLDDMAADLLGLLDALGLDRVHLVGASMGGYIAQTVALAAPARIRSLTLFMTSTGSRRVGRSKPSLVRRLLRGRRVEGREEAVEAALETFGLLSGPGYPVDAQHLRDLAGRSFDRRYDAAGYRRQLAAVMAQPNRTPQLSSITVPTLVVHGLHDPLVSATGGIALARAIPRAKFVGYSGMGHNLPRELWGELAAEIGQLAARARSGEPLAREGGRAASPLPDSRPED